MPLTGFGFQNSTNWQFKGTTSGFSPNTQADGLSFSMSGLDLAIWSEAYCKSLTLLPTAASTISVDSFTNLVFESTTFAHVKSIFINTAGGNITWGPAASNGLVWFFNTSSDTVAIRDGGFFAYSSSPTDNGNVVDGTHKSLTFTNTGTLATAWSSITTYIVGNKVSLGGINYVCILGNLNHTPPNTVYWSVVDTATVDIMILGSTV